MENRWYAILHAISILTLAMGLFYLGYAAYSYGIGHTHGFIFILEASIMLIISATFYLARKNVKRLREGEPSGFILPVQVVFPLVLILLSICLILTFIH